MSAHRFYLSPAQWSREKPVLDPGDSHHCADVLRLKPGDRLSVFDGEGRVAEAELADVHRKQCVLRLGRTHVTPDPRCSLTVAQAVPKGKNMDLILQKAVELGASAIVPLLTSRTVVRIDDEGDAERKQQRWQQIALEACKQCGRNTVPRVAPPSTAEQFLDRAPAAELLLLASLQPDARPIKEVLASFAVINGRPPESVAILVGPEGDFTPGEIAQLKAAGAFSVTLGPTILRSETAALYCLSVLGHELF
jgi:16S rRNA (uracil1498-N3)-methyltransferase